MNIDFAAIMARYDTVNRRLSQPEILTDAKALRDLGREQQRLGQIVEHANRFHEVRRLLGENQVLMNGSAGQQDDELLQLAKEEHAVLIAEEQQLEQALTLLLLPIDDNDAKNVILEIRSGTGGDEAALFCGELFRLYSRFAESQHWQVDILSASTGSMGGFKEIIALIEGENVYSTLKFESGVHRVQRVPATETQGRVHTSAVTVAVLPEAEDVEAVIADKDLRVDVYRSSGPGGQSVNTTDSAVRVTHIPSGLVVSCQDEKSQHKNKAKALKILRARLLDKMQEEQDQKLSAERRSIVKTGDRSEKIRTYNFPQDRLTDHRINLTVHNLPHIMQGGLLPVVIALRTHYQALLLAQGQ